jgi:hypothetical protein
MKTIAYLATGALAFAATAVSAQSVESGYPRGSLAVAAIERGDLARAEALLKDDELGATSDPARLINLGEVYMSRLARRARLDPPYRGRDARRPLALDPRARPRGARPLRDRAARHALIAD